MRGTIKWNGERSELEVRLLRFSHDIKDRVKAVPGARWDASARVWRVPPIQVRQLFANLEGEQFSVDDQVIELLDEAAASSDGSATGVATTDAARVVNHGSRSPELRLAATAGYDSVSRVLERVSAAIRGAFGGAAWVSGTLSSFSRAASGHIYMDLVEDDANGRTVATLSAVLFASHAKRVEAKLNAAGVSLQEGLTVAFRGQVDAYRQRGTVQLVVDDCDPAVSRGEIELQRQRVVEALQKAGLIGKNARLALPELPRRVALVTAPNSDAYHDVIKQLRDASVGVDVVLFGVAVQGDRLESSVLYAFQQIAKLSPPPDMVIVCRGGGAANELAGWDNLEVATVVANSPIPVVVGIGHERDQSALDEVAHRVPTPTAAGRLIAERWSRARERCDRARHLLHERAERHLAQSGRSVRQHSNHLSSWVHRVVGQLRRRVQIEIPQQMVRSVEGVLAAQGSTLKGSAREIERSATRRMADAHEEVARRQRSLASAGGPERVSDFRRELTFARATLERRTQARIQDAEAQVRSIAKRMHLVHPQRVLERGFAIVRDEQGAVLRDAADSTVGARLRLTLASGTLRATVDATQQEDD